MIVHSRNKLYLVLAIFIVPMIASWLLFYFHNHFHLKTMNHGQLISPPIHAAFLTKDQPKQVWRILHIDNGQCDQACQYINFQLNQVRKVLGKDQGRLSIVSINGQSVIAQELQSQFSQLDSTKTVANSIFLIDPLGNGFMYYPETAKPMDILKDLKRVLEVSQIG